ncbi:MAG: GNAT family N-acetyltransferase [Candidatus Zixiibacteriota bacterium]
MRRLLTEELPSHAAVWLQRRTLLGSPTFVSLWETMGGLAVYWAWFEREKLIAVLPSVQFGTGRLARLQAMPDGLYTRAHFLEGAADKAAIVGQFAASIASQTFSKVYIHDYYGQLGTVAGYERIECETNQVDIGSGNWLPPDKKLQSEIRKALREEVPVRDFSLNRHLDPFLDLMSRTEKRHGRVPRYSGEFYRALGRLAMTDMRIRWLVCEQGDELAASHIYFVEGDMLLNWQVYFDKRFSSLKPNQLITYSLARELALRGVRILNLGATPVDAESLTAYKMKWGGDVYRYPCWRRYSWLGRLL